MSSQMIVKGNNARSKLLPLQEGEALPLTSIDETTNDVYFLVKTNESPLEWLVVDKPLPLYNTIQHSFIDQGHITNTCSHGVVGYEVLAIRRWHHEPMCSMPKMIN